MDINTGTQLSEKYQISFKTAKTNILLPFSKWSFIVEEDTETKGNK